MSSIVKGATKLALPALVFAFGYGLSTAFPWPLTRICVLSFLIQFLVWVPSAAMQSEKFYDLTGALTYLSMTVLSCAYAGQLSARQTVNSALAMLWATRLGLFLFARVMNVGSDARFFKVRGNPLRFLLYWIIQGLWIFLTELPVWVSNARPDKQPISARDYLGWAIWTTGFLCEVIADEQKRRHRQDKEAHGRWIERGLWRCSQHPNYFGEILLWIGMFVTASANFQGLDWLAAISPLFVYTLLTRVSGIPPLEELAAKRWGSDPKWQAYHAKTSKLVPWFKSA